MANGWIQKRHMQTGRSLSSGVNRENKGPLREVKEVLRLATNMFEHDSVVFVCGHQGRRSRGSSKGRCRKCKLAGE